MIETMMDLRTALAALCAELRQADCRQLAAKIVNAGAVVLARRAGGMDTVEAHDQLMRLVRRARVPATAELVDAIAAHLEGTPRPIGYVRRPIEDDLVAIYDVDIIRASLSSRSEDKRRRSSYLVDVDWCLVGFSRRPIRYGTTTVEYRGEWLDAGAEFLEQCRDEVALRELDRLGAAERDQH